MKRLIIALTAVCMIASAASAQDMEEKMWNVYLGAGVGLPMGDFGDAYNLGLHGMGAFGYRVAPALQIRAKVEFQTFGIDEDAWIGVFDDPDTDVEAVEGGSLNAIMFGADGRYAFQMEDSKIAPFIVGGLGMASLSNSDFDVTVDGEVFTFEGGDSQTEFYFEIGAGADFLINPSMAIFIQGRFVSIQTEGSSTSFIPVTVGVRF